MIFLIQIQAKEKKLIDLGRRGEHAAREVLFDISGWAELYGQGEAHLVAQRYKDLAPYPVVITQDNTLVHWEVTSVDTDQPGYGQCELIYVTDGRVVKSIIYQTHTDLSLSDPVSPPDSPDIYGSVVKAVGDLEKVVGTYSDGINTAIEKADSAFNLASGVSSTAESANSTAEEAKTKTEEAKNIAMEAMFLAEQLNSTINSTQGVASSAKDLAQSAKSLSEQANQTSIESKSIAEDAHSIAGEAKSLSTESKSIANTAKQTSEEALSISNTASENAESANNTAGEALKVANEALEVANSLSDEVKSLAEQANFTSNSAQDKANEAKSRAEEAYSLAETANTESSTAKTTSEEAKSLAEHAKSTSEGASTVASEAKTIAETAKSTAESAQSVAEGAQSTADQALELANTAKDLASVQPNMAQNDDSAPDFVKNRTHYEEVVDGEIVVHTLDEKFIPSTIARDSKKMDKNNPVGNGTFSMNRKANTTVGQYSTALGYSNTASGNASHAEGYNTIASGTRQHVQGQYNVADPDSKYFHIVGNGKSDSFRSNAHTIDRNGLGWFAGGLKVGGTGQDDETSKEVATVDQIPTTLPNPNTLTFEGAVNDTYDGSAPIKVKIPETPTIPEKLPNPHTLKFTGAVTGEYDGSSEIIIDIPEGGDKQVQGDWSQNDETSPDFIKGRTHYEEVVRVESISWDGNVEGLEPIPYHFIAGYSGSDSSSPSTSVKVYKMAEDVLTPDQLEGATFGWVARRAERTAVITNAENYLRPDGRSLNYEFLVVVFETMSREDNLGDIYTIEPGVYFIWHTGSFSYGKSLSIPNYEGFIVNRNIKQLDEKFIPNNILRNSSIATDDEIFEMLVNEDALPVVVDSDGSVLSDENGNMLLW